jgi:hypothetical protein
MNPKKHTVHPHIHQPSLLTLQQRTDYWKECDVNKLTGHFHQYGGSKVSQFERLSMISLGSADIQTLFQKTKVIHSLSIHFGLDNETSLTDAFTFTPMITVNHKGNRVLNPPTAAFKHGLVQTTTGAAKVPHEFKEWLNRNWMELDVSLVDDVFTSSFEAHDKKTRKPVPFKRISKRLLAYHFTNSTNPDLYHFIRKHKNRIEQFIVHLGVDKNKLGHKEEFAFSPVIELHLLKPKKPNVLYQDIHEMGLKSSPFANNDKKRGIVYFEYISPCPPSCGDEIHE